MNIIKDSINIEGLAWENELENLPICKCRTYNCNFKLNIKTANGIKDIYQISLKSYLEHKKQIKLKDSNIIILKGSTSYKIISVEDTLENNINYIEETSFFNVSYRDLSLIGDNIEVYIIDAAFSLTNCYELNCYLTYLFVFDISNEDNIIDFEKASKEEFPKHNLIDITEEFA